MFQKRLEHDDKGEEWEEMRPLEGHDIYSE